MDKNYMDQNEYFSKRWSFRKYDKYELSGWALLDKVKPDDTMLDVGCGPHPFKQHFGDRVYGIDPANASSDEKVSIEDFQSDKQWDILFALGSINFGSEDKILNQIEKMTTLLKPNGRIYWRQNPGVNDHDREGSECIDFFPWSINKNYEYAKKFGYEVVDCRWERGGRRIYAEWVKTTY